MVSGDPEVPVVVDLEFDEGCAPSLVQWGVVWAEFAASCGVEPLRDWDPFPGVLEEEAAGDRVYVKLLADCDEDHPVRVSLEWWFAEGFSVEVYRPFAVVLGRFVREYGGRVVWFSGEDSMLDA